MPYIPEEDRAAVLAGGSSTAGELNFEITTMINEYLENNGINYQKLNDVLGALEGAKMEFYRRVVVPYEDTKIQLNGDVY